MEQGLDGEPMTDSMVGHFDACLGCMACVTACPSGVQYDKLIEATRAQVERRYDRPGDDRLLASAIFALFPYPRRLRLLRGPLAVYQRSGLQRLVQRSGLLERLAPTLAAMEALAPPLGRAGEAAGSSRGRRRRDAPWSGCSPAACSASSSRTSTRRPHGSSRRGLRGRRPARPGVLRSAERAQRPGAGGRGVRPTLIDAFEAAGVETVVVNAAGCGSSMKEYADLLADDPAYAERAARFAASVRDVSELLAELGPVAPRHPLPVTIAYHDACHLAHAQGVRAQPRALLRGIPELAAARDRRPGDLLRFGRRLQPAQPRARPASSASARPATSSPPAQISSSPRTPAASCRSLRRPGGGGSR